MYNTQNSIENPALNPDNYIQTRVPDVLELSSLIRKAKGVNRTMLEFAKECDISASTFSRIANGKITQPLSWDILYRIWSKADLDANISLSNLIIANGMAIKEPFRQKENHSPSSQINERGFSIESEMKTIISAALLERGLTISYQKEINISEGIPCMAARCERGNLLVQIQGYEPPYWKYKSMSPMGIKGCTESESLNKEIDYECEAERLFHEEAEYFLIDDWKPEKLYKVKMSYVFSDRKLYESFYRKFEGVTVHNWISIILIDLKLRSVIEERFLQRADGKTCLSVFELPLLMED